MSELSLNMSQEKFDELAYGMDKVNEAMWDEIQKSAPRCHFRPMMLEQSDSVDADEWWECLVCGHTKEI